MDFRGGLRRLDERQQRSRRLALPFAVIKKFGDDDAGSLGALIAYYGFFSIFPLLLVFVTILGLVLQGDSSLRDSIRTSTLGHFPVIGDELQKQNGLHGSVVSLVIGLAGALWGGLGVTNAAQAAFDRVWAVPRKHRASFVQTRLRGLATLGALGVLSIAGSLASGFVSGGGRGPLFVVAGIGVSLILNVALFLSAFRLLTASNPPLKTLLPGSVFAAIAWEALQLLGGWYIGHVLRHATGTSGVFGLVIALLSWLHLGAQSTLFGAELNVVLERKLWPRSLFGTQLPADEETLEALAKVEERTPDERVEVTFDE